MSGFGGIGGVCTVLVIVTLEPDSTVAEYVAGSTPDPSATPALVPAATTAMLASSQDRARHPLMSCMVSPPVTRRLRCSGGSAPAPRWTTTLGYMMCACCALCSTGAPIYPSAPGPPAARR